MGEVRSLNGNAPAVLTRNETCVAELRKLLERAESGDVVGVALCAMHQDKTCSYSVFGMAGGFTMVGALEMAKAELVEINQGLHE